MIVIDEFTARYVGLWNEPDAATRAAAVAQLWSADARVCTGANEYVGLDAITQRVATAYEKFVRGQDCMFRQLGSTEAHHDSVRIRWEMVPVSGGNAVSGGTQFLLLDPDGRVRSDHQFIDF